MIMSQNRGKLFLILTKCEPVPLNEALWGEYQNWEKYFIAINTFFFTFWCKNDWFSYQKLQNVEHRHIWYHSK